MTEHTRLPWAVNPTGLIHTGDNGNLRFIARVETHIRFNRLDDEDKANAEFIVRVCNSHNDLLEALRECMKDSLAAADKRALPMRRYEIAAVAVAKATQ